MSETMKVVLMILILIASFALSIVFASWKTRRACEFILRDLREKGAFDPGSAIVLPYAKSSLFHIGMRDYRPKALGALVKFDRVRMAEGERYYLHEGQEPDSNS